MACAQPVVLVEVVLQVEVLCADSVVGVAQLGAEVPFSVASLHTDAEITHAHALVHLAVLFLGGVVLRVGGGVNQRAAGDFHL